MQPTSDSFAAFYAEYPRHVARKSAEKAWARCATSPEAIEQIMAGLRAQLPAMLKKDKEFIPHPSSWLNQRRWMDEIYALVNAMPSKMRNIACQECGGTGVYQEETLFCDSCKTEIVASRWEGECPGCGNGTMRIKAELERCSCPIGQLPGVLAGIAE